VIAIVLCAVVLVLGVAVGVMLFLTRDTASPYKLGQALEQYKVLQQRDQSGSRKLQTSLPPTGVYSYTTTGSESARAPGLLASSQPYPRTTTMTVFSAGCGEDWRWQPLSNRYEDLVVCRTSGAAMTLQSRYDVEEFYGDTDRRFFSCVAGSVLLPAGAQTGNSLSGECTNRGNSNSGGLTIGYSGEVADDEVLSVAGVQVPTIHIVLKEKMTGDTIGTGTESLWLDSNSGLLVKEIRSEQTRSKSSVGWVPSTETFDLMLVSTTPKR
jgi:hypothetical protein